MILVLLLLFVLGVVAASFGALAGLGGGVIIVPALMFLGPSVLDQEISSSLAVGISLTVLIFTALTSTIVFARQKRIDYRSGWLFVLTSAPGAVLGASLTSKLDASQFQLYFGFFMLLMSGLLIARNYIKPLHIRWSIERTYTDKSGETAEYGYNVPVALLLGFAVGIVSGLFGIGGGSLFVPAMVLLFRYPPHVATATSMLVILISATLGSATHIMHGDVDWSIVAALAPGAVFGGWFGAWLAGKMSGNGLMWVLRISLLLLAIRLIWQGFAGG